jgi:hypothetical protein
MANQRITTAAEKVYDQLVTKRARNTLALWSDPEFSIGERSNYKQIAAHIATMSESDRRVIEMIVREVAADTLLDMLGLICGNNDIGIVGDWKLMLDGQDVGGVLLDTVVANEQRD